MDNKVIMALVIILVIMGLAGLFVLNPTHVKTDTRVIVTSNSTLHEGDSFSIKLTDLNNTPIANQVVNITIVDANGTENHQQVTTDVSGNGILQLNGSSTVGKYNVVVTYGGNENYSNSNTTQSLEMKAIEVQPKVEQITAEPYLVGTSDDRCVMYWSDGSVTYRGETGDPITKEQYEYLKTYGKR